MLRMALAEIPTDNYIDATTLIDAVNRLQQSQIDPLGFSER